MKPLIGITTYFVSNEELEGRRVRGAEGQYMLMSNLDYSRSVLEGGRIGAAIRRIASQGSRCSAP